MPRETSAQNPPKRARTSKIDERFELLKAEIHTIYVKDRNTLPQTMEIIEERHGFKPSIRTWKTQLKAWHFDKYLDSKGMEILIAKKEKRAREEGKQTVIFHGDTEITEQRMENFKKRRIGKEVQVLSPSAETPANVTYHTPLASYSANEDDDISHRIDDPEIDMGNSDDCDDIPEADHGDAKGTLDHPSPASISNTLITPLSPLFATGYGDSARASLATDETRSEICHSTGLEQALERSIQEFSDNSEHSLSLQQSLAEKYISQERFEDAACLLRKIISSYEKSASGIFSLGQAKCERILAKLEERNGQFELATRTLISALSYYMYSDCYAEMGDIARDILRLKYTLERRGGSVFPLVGLMIWLDIIEMQKPEIPPNSSLSAAIWWTIVDAAKVWDKFPEAEKLMLVAIGKLQNIPVGKHDMAIIYAHLRWSYDLQVRGRWAEEYEALEYAQCRSKTFRFLLRGETKLITRILDSCQEQVELHYCSEVNREREAWMEKIELIRMLKPIPRASSRWLSPAEIIITAHKFQISRKEMEEDKNGATRRDPIILSEDGEDLEGKEIEVEGSSCDMTDAESDRYGVTFSVSDVTGVSNSVYYAESIRG